MALKVAAGEELNRYGYGERPLREEITQPVSSSAGSEIAVVTRNLYGALVLNTLNAMFIDIDFPEKSAGASAAGRCSGMSRTATAKRAGAVRSAYRDLGKPAA